MIGVGQVISYPPNVSDDAATRRSRRGRTDLDLGEVMGAWGRAQAAVGAAAGEFFGELDVTTAQMRALGQLRRHGRMTGRELAERLEVTPSTVVPLCDRLEERGYLQRVPDRTDRRMTWLELTPLGEEFFRGLWRPARAKLLEAVATFTAEERATFARLLNEIADHLEEPDSPAARQAARPPS
jgi:DNA-binding MarR family transcriptional regulator